ncbi:hypothetical protein VP01_3401g2 [Puccinia sorghi]|uniref:Uncharacterized protein n=1 Tax=Puccinia sorghi TaxID=27349 RepID=A0A0L6UWN6_9BASI|nr:hypothetical protein VP01_3401g2 [Puccinia sorghi]
MIVIVYTRKKSDHPLGNGDLLSESVQRPRGGRFVVARRTSIVGQPCTPSTRHGGGKPVSHTATRRWIDRTMPKLTSACSQGWNRSLHMVFAKNQHLCFFSCGIETEHMLPQYVPQLYPFLICHPSQSFQNPPQAPHSISFVPVPSFHFQCYSHPCYLPPKNLCQPISKLLPIHWRITCQAAPQSIHLPAIITRNQSNQSDLQSNQIKKNIDECDDENAPQEFKCLTNLNLYIAEKKKFKSKNKVWVPFPGGRHLPVQTRSYQCWFKDTRSPVDWLSQDQMGCDYSTRPRYSINVASHSLQQNADSNDPPDKEDEMDMDALELLMRQIYKNIIVMFYTTNTYLQSEYVAFLGTKGTLSWAKDLVTFNQNISLFPQNLAFLSPRCPTLLIILHSHLLRINASKTTWTLLCRPWPVNCMITKLPLVSPGHMTNCLVALILLQLLKRAKFVIKSSSLGCKNPRLYLRYWRAMICSPKRSSSLVNSINHFTTMSATSLFLAKINFIFCNCFYLLCLLCNLIERLRIPNDVLNPK